MNPDQKRRRKAFGLEHEEEDATFWRNVLWSDEKWWYVDAPRNRSMDGAWVEDPSEVPVIAEKKWGSKRKERLKAVRRDAKRARRKWKRVSKVESEKIARVVGLPL